MATYTFERFQHIGEHPHERTFKVPGTTHTPPRLLKIFRAPELWTTAPVKVDACLEARTPMMDGIPAWLGFEVVPGTALAQLNIQEGTWFAGLRQWIDGTPLAHATSAIDNWPQTALAIALKLRDLHEIGCVHADLQPHNVIIDPTEKIWLIDLPLFATSPNERGHVAGSAPMMAPELWRGMPPTIDTDIYALGCLIAWMGHGGQNSLTAHTITQWAQAHETSEHQLPAQWGGRLRGIVERMLSPHPDNRPPLQALIDELTQMVEHVPACPVIYKEHPHQPVLETILTSLAHQTRHQTITVEAPAGGGKSRMMSQLAHRIELLGHTVITLTGSDVSWRLQQIKGHHTTLEDGPWSSLLNILKLLAPNTSTGRLPYGDQLHTFEWLIRRFEDELPPQGVCIVWDDFDHVSPDVRAWWKHVFGQLSHHRLPPIQLLVSVTEEHTLSPSSICHVLQQPSLRQWSRWRATTARAEIRDIAQGEWERLVEQHGQRIGALLEALNHHLGLTARQSIDDTQSKQLSWSETTAQMKSVIEQRAYREALALAANTATHIKHPCPPEALALWTQAMLAVGADKNEATQLLEALSGHQRHDVLLLQLKLMHGLGLHQQGITTLDAFQTQASPITPKEQAAQSRWLAQLLLSSGQLSKAEEEANQALTQLQASTEDWTHAQTLDVDPDDLAHLSVLANAATAIAGKREGIDALKMLAPKLETLDTDPALRAKCYAYIAIGLTRNNEREAATDAYVRALEEIEDAGLASELPLYLLNVGTAYHQQGRLGLAREYYARGTRVAQQTTRPTTRAWLLCNQANIDMVLGRLNEATSLIQRARQVAKQHNLEAIDATAQAFEGFIQASRGQHQRALLTYKECLDRSSGVSAHLQAELKLHSVEVLIATEASEDAQHELNDARKLIDKHQIATLQDHHGILRARLQWIDGNAMGVMSGIELFRRKLISAMEAGNYKLIIQQSPYLIEQLTLEGLMPLREEIQEVVTRARNAIAMGLTRELREDFFANIPKMQISAAQDQQPKHTPEVRPSAVPGTPYGVPGTADGGAINASIIERFYRMLSLNEIILRTTALKDLWPKALQIALSLSGAERGFLLLKTRTNVEGEFTIAASSDVDGQEIAQPHLNVSLTIAQEAAQTGRTVITLNAREDKRFNVALSVVDLDLTSVLCVPVRDGQGLLGALYLDHRFQPGIFQGQVPRMMEAFGHQLALAITNIERLQALDEERIKLNTAHEELNAILNEREARLIGLQERLAHLSEEVVRQRDRVELHDSFPKIAFTSKIMERVLLQVERIAKSDIPVVVTGESGTGKELIAQAVHHASPRASGPFVAFNCGAVTETLFESEMFGHLKGAFTGATMDRRGLFQSANGGTIFLDELGEMPANMQVKLLRVLQERKVRRLGSTQSEPIDVRLVAATNKDLLAMIEEGTFREDLYYRLAAFTIDLPPLRDRREDIPLIAHTLITQISETIVHRPLRLSPEAALLLSECAWAGNIRELENTLRAACVLCDTDEITERELASLVKFNTSASTPDVITPPRRSRPVRDGRGRKPKASRVDVEEALDAHDGDRTLAAQALGVSERTLYRYIRKYEI